MYIIMSNTKRKINRHNKTKKNRHNKTKKNKQLSITDVYNKNDTNKTNEKRLSCFLTDNNTIKNFTFNLFYYILQYWKKNTHSKWFSIIRHSLIEKIDGKIILKIGFTNCELNKIIQFINNKEHSQFLLYLEDKFLKVTACINYLCEPEYTIYHVNFNKELQTKFLKQLKNYLFTTDITWKDIMNTYKLLKNNEERNLYNFLIFDFIYAADDIDSVYRQNLSNMSFFRERLSKFNHNKSNFFKLNTCKKSIVDDNFNEYGIYNSTEKYKINKNSPYYKIMIKHNKNILSGPSGSTALLYITLFQFYKVPFTYKNKILLLGMIIADYIPLWHALSEILLLAYPEIKDKNIPEFTLNTNSVVYSINLLKKFIQ